MTKYSTPSIEVVNFSSSDAPRIGMQWWMGADGTHHYNPNGWIPVPTGSTPINIGYGPRPDMDLTPFGVPCTSVTWSVCKEEQFTGGRYWDDPSALGEVGTPVCEDGRASC